MNLHLEQKLHHLSVDKTVDRFSIDVGDEVSSFESCFMCRAAVFYVLIKQTRQFDIIL